MLFLIGAVVIVIVLALVIKPLLTSAAFPTSQLSEKDVETESSLILPTPSSSYEVEEHSWNGTITVLHFLDDLPLTETNDTANDTVSSASTSRIFLGNSTVTAAYPIVPDDKPNIPEGAVPKPTMEYRGLMNTSIIFEETYTLKYNSFAFLVDVVKPPFVIAYTVTPTTSDPYYLNNPHYCFMTITVRDPTTMDVIATEGYGRIYSTDSSKHITLYRSGSYHVTIYGNMVRANVKIQAGI